MSREKVQDKDIDRDGNRLIPLAAKKQSPPRGGIFRKSKPQAIQLPCLGSPAVETSISSLEWPTSSFTDSMTTPSLSPDGMYAGFWGTSDGSVSSSVSSAGSTRHDPARTLKRPWVPKEARCMSVSLVVDGHGVAQVRREEVDLESIEYQQQQQRQRQPREQLTGPFMARMVSSAGSDYSVSKKLTDMSLMSSNSNSSSSNTGSASLSREEDVGSTLALTPSLARHVTKEASSPDQIDKDWPRQTSSSSSSSATLRTPESSWDEFDDSEDEDEEVSTSMCFSASSTSLTSTSSSSSSWKDPHDAQSAVQEVFERKQGTAVMSGFMGSAMPKSPLAAPRISQMAACSICQIKLKSMTALTHHARTCFVKQAPFVSTDFFPAADDHFFADLLHDVPDLSLAALLDSRAASTATAAHDLLMSPRKKSRRA